MKRKNIKFIAVLLLFTTLFQYLPAFARGASNISPNAEGEVKLVIFTQNPNGEFEIRMRLDPIFDITYLTKSNYSNYNTSDFDTIIVNSFLPTTNSSFYNMLNESVYTDGVGLFFLGGFYPALTDLNPDKDILADEDTGILPVIFDEPFTVEEETYIDQSWVAQIELKVNDAFSYNNADPTGFGVLQRNVVWESSPLVKERILVEDATSGTHVLVYRPDVNREDSYNFDEGEPLVVHGMHGNGHVLWMSMGVGFILSTFAQYEISGVGPEWRRTEIPDTEEDHNPSDGWNKPFYLWPYFNFFIYQSAMYLGGRNANNIDTYASWDFSPIPHEAEATWWMIFVAGLWVFNFVLFFTLGRKKRREGDIKPIVEEGEEKDEDSPAEEKPAEEQPEDDKQETGEA